MAPSNRGRAKLQQQKLLRGRGVPQVFQLLLCSIFILLLLFCTCYFALAVLQLLLCSSCFAIIVLQLLLCDCCFAIAVLQLSFRNCSFASAVLHLLFCNCCFAIVDLKLLLCNCWFEVVVLQLLLGNCCFSLVVLHLSFRNWDLQFCGLVSVVFAIVALRLVKSPNRWKAREVLTVEKPTSPNRRKAQEVLKDEKLKKPYQMSIQKGYKPTIGVTRWDMFLFYFKKNVFKNKFEVWGARNSIPDLRLRFQWGNFT